MKSFQGNMVGVTGAYVVTHNCKCGHAAHESMGLLKQKPSLARAISTCKQSYIKLELLALWMHLNVTNMLKQDPTVLITRCKLCYFSRSAWVCNDHNVPGFFPSPSPSLFLSNLILKCKFGPFSASGFVRIKTSFFFFPPSLVIIVFHSSCALVSGPLLFHPIWSWTSLSGSFLPGRALRPFTFSWYEATLLCGCIHSAGTFQSGPAAPLARTQRVRRLRALGVIPRRHGPRCPSPLPHNASPFILTHRMSASCYGPIQQENTQRHKGRSWFKSGLEEMACR